VSTPAPAGSDNDNVLGGLADWRPGPGGEEGRLGCHQGFFLPLVGLATLCRGGRMGCASLD
jgi:hypothetical protein